LLVSRVCRSGLGRHDRFDARRRFEWTAGNGGSSQFDGIDFRTDIARSAIRRLDD
jgi:hypothetical protein